MPGNMPTTYPDPLGPMWRSQQVFNFVGYRFDLFQGLAKPTQERWIALSQKINFLLGQETCSVRQFMSLIGLLTATEKQVVSGCLHMRPIQWHLKKHCQDHSPAKVSPCSSEVVGPKQDSERSHFTPLTTCPTTVYRRLKQRLGRTLRRLHCKRPLVQTRRRLAHKLARTQSGFVGPETVRAFVLEPDHPSLHRQHNSGFLHQQRGRY